MIKLVSCVVGEGDHKPNATEINDEDVIIDRDDESITMKRHSGIPNTPCNVENCNEGCVHEKI